MNSGLHLPHLVYDSVVFGLSDNELKILIIEYRNTGLFALPGGFVRTEEDLRKKGIKRAHKQNNLLTSNAEK